MNPKGLTLLRGVYLHQKHSPKNPGYEEILEGYIEANHEHDSDAVKQLVKDEVTPVLDDLIERNFLEKSPCGADIYIVTRQGEKVMDAHMSEAIKNGGGIDMRDIISEIQEFLKEEQDEDPSSSHSPTPKPRFRYPDPSDN
tara:strand:+ start:51296 stop:51718 length:423 start_codon:yes stop_codon:yes gene_type:complete